MKKKIVGAVAVAIPLATGLYVSNINNTPDYYQEIDTSIPFENGSENNSNKDNTIFTSEKIFTYNITIENKESKDLKCVLFYNKETKKPDWRLEPKSKTENELYVVDKLKLKVYKTNPKKEKNVNKTYFLYEFWNNKNGKIQLSEFGSLKEDSLLLNMPLPTLFAFKELEKYPPVHFPFAKTKGDKWVSEDGNSNYIYSANVRKKSFFGTLDLALIQSSTKYKNSVLSSKYYFHPAKGITNMKFKNSDGNKIFFNLVNVEH